MSTGDASIFARVYMNAFSDSSVWVLVASEAWTFAAAFVDLVIFLSSGSFAMMTKQPHSMIFLLARF